ncbi:hypothetical protein DXV76_19630 [Rhodobacteraceae bacterium CCMM004]|nr:hypothetical protein DXV76_19630 [Rhodobacteraceae bacterium CCMM004]
MKRLAIVPFLALGALAACNEAEMAALIDDPGAFSCRERGVALMNVPFEQTASDLMRTNIFGISTYRVRAGGRTFSCIVNSDGLITGFSRV